MAMVVNGNELSRELKAGLKDRIDALRMAGKRTPCLAVILVGENPASLSYVKGKEKACASLGMDNRMFHLKENTTQEELEHMIRKCNEDPDIDGILVQLPLPKGLDEFSAIMCIDPSKDVDGLHPINVGRLYLNNPGFAPCTPLGVMEVLKKMHCDPAGRRAVVVGRSKLVGTPVARLLQNANATVTVCHSQTHDLKYICREADILIAAVGKPKFITEDYIKEGAYVVDVGVNRLSNGHLCGDVDFEGVQAHCTAITPVPGGVGPMTITMLLMNTMKAYEEREARHGTR
ncbi:MAG: bifunctional methylenetetrahydrofolate dehydrogenase/methenyltetrahydrofolate cyclohydrolase FolD [Bulleidia sp.]|nr:bifunctional methylenetetrahydrofolate dehydrogenase/methenyltetrahydrofolate cyclohydrolase FolD [Bulleidia sp.]